MYRDLQYVGVVWHAAGWVWLELTEVNVTAVSWVTPSVCDKAVRRGPDVTGSKH